MNERIFSILVFLNEEVGPVLLLLAAMYLVLMWIHLQFDCFGWVEDLGNTIVRRSMGTRWFQARIVVRMYQVSWGEAWSALGPCPHCGGQGNCRCADMKLDS